MSASRNVVAGSGVEPITFEVIRHKLTSIVAQQSTVLKAVSGSPLVTEANDCNTGIYLPDGGIVAFGPHILFHAGSMELVVSHIVSDCGENPGIGEGDTFITNDPYKGALHMPDVTMLEPVVFDGELIAWVGACEHVLDVGGMVPTSWVPTATEIYQEGLIIPPVKLVEGGTIRQDVWNLILTASRLPAQLGLELKAMLAANRHGREGILRLADRYGVQTLRAVMATMLDITEAQVRDRISRLPDGTFRARNYLDHDGNANRLYRVQVELTKSGDGLVFDFSESSEQAPGFVNCTRSGLRGGVTATVLPVLCYDIPWNSGAMRAVRIEAPEGLVINAKWPAPCSSATLGGSFMVQSTAGIALSQLVSCSDELRGEAMAVTTGSIGIMHMAGLNQYGEGFGGALTEAMMGGGGATIRSRGVDYAGPHESLNYRVSNVETDEANYPVLYLSRFAATDSAGAGRNHGGITGGSAWTPYGTHGIHIVMAAHGVESPTSQGIHGGLPGSCNYFEVVRGSDVFSKLPAGVTSLDELDGDRVNLGAKPGFLPLASGDVIGWTWDGGGGWGDPAEADPVSIARDVSLGLLTAASAQRYYGVVTGDAGLDAEATNRRRQSIRDGRKSWPARAGCDTTDVTGGLSLGEHLVLVNGDLIACDCGRVLSPAAVNWKAFAAHSALTAEDLGARIRLHADLEAHGYACPGCGVLLDVEVRHRDDEPLESVRLLP